MKKHTFLALHCQLPRTAADRRLHARGLVAIGVAVRMACRRMLPAQPRISEVLSRVYRLQNERGRNRVPKPDGYSLQNIFDTLLRPE